MKIYRLSKSDKEYLTPEEMDQVKDRFKDIQCSFAKDKDGYYCYTHRARSKSYPTIDDIPESKVDFINSTSSAKVMLWRDAGIKKCPKCGNDKVYYKEVHPDTDINEIVLWCQNCGEVGE